MATNNKCSVHKKETPVCKFHNKLTVDHALHTEGLATAQIKIEAWEIVRAYAICSLSKYEQTFEYYRDMTNFELFDMKDSAEIIKTNIDEYVKQDTALGELISDTSKLLNDLQVKLHDANNAGCTMRNCLQSIMGFKDNDVPHQLKDVTEPANELSKDGKKAAHAMVSVAGIHTFSNLETLKPFSSDLSEKLTALKTLTDSLMNTANTDQENAQVELDNVLKQLNAHEFESHGLKDIAKAEDRTLEFICGEQCEPIECVEEICKELGNKESEAGCPSGSHLQHDID
jgi:hypothetical protein